MSCCVAFSAFKPVALVAALALTGVGGYNLISTGCPLGSCKTGAAGKSQTVSTTQTESCPMSGCSGSQDAEPVAMLVADGATDCESVCTEEMKAACAEGECPFAAQGAGASLVSDTQTDDAACPHSQQPGCEGKDPAACPGSIEQTETPSQTAVEETATPSEG